MQAKSISRACIRLNADETSSAQSAGLFFAENYLDLQNRSNYIASIIEKNRNNTFGAVLELLFLYGFRISEVISLRGSCIKSDGTIKVNLLKTTGFRVVVPVVCVEFWASFRYSPGPISDVYSRFYFYREFKKRGIHAQFGINSSFSTTHYLRHLRVLNMMAAGYSADDIQLYISHKSIKSLRYYEQKPK